MTDDMTLILLWMLIVASLGFMIGWVCGEQVSRRQSAEAMVQDLSERLEQACSETPTQNRQLKEMRSVLNDVHKQILAVSKALKNPAR
jgi:Tfp pilus assembly protein PilO